MDMGNLMQLGAQMFQSQLDKDRDGQLEITEIASALMGLMSNGQGQSQAGGLSGLMSMVSGMQGSGNGDLMSIAASWLGKGENAPISGGQLTQMLGSDKIAAFAQQLGLSQEQAVSGLQAAIPQVVDKASPDGALDLGNMLDAVGGVSGAIGLASKLFGR
ncbi:MULTISPECIES: YidB family protein [Thiothrix]|jgi:uncharacterized protein YidB (DUF937 family)|uniref:DUF937 domain-containing protein n=1 Tax=Thiothrix unzii TaxID=111769 RepID=A0A975IFV0_9GAMM|nr:MULTISPECIES: YidB family protein [Thiothrix]MDX9988656.1 YidB family protein [Thiothrix unzii]QTR52281.1 DUF937 domain-containing protein [Thiothrix unzii]